MDDELSPAHRTVLRGIKEHIEFLEKQVASLETLILKAINPWEEGWKILQTLPGVSAISATSIIAEIGDDMSQFAGMSEIASWAGLSGQ
jgi:transposase